MRREWVDHRILGAVRCLDAVTGLPLPQPLMIQATGLVVMRNRRGDYVLAVAPDHPVLQAYSTRFLQPPASPTVGAITVPLQVFDPSGEYLPRQFRLQVPRNPDPKAATTADSLFQPVRLLLYPSPTARTRSTWAVVRATVKETGTNHRLPWALIRVVRNSNTPAAVLPEPVLQLADWRGEALIAVAGIPVRTWEEGTGPVLANDVEVTLEVVFDPMLTKIPDTADLSILPDPNASYLPHPEDLNDRRSSLRLGTITPYRLASGRSHTSELVVTLS